MPMTPAVYSTELGTLIPLSMFDFVLRSHPHPHYAYIQCVPKLLDMRDPGEDNIDAHS